MKINNDTDLMHSCLILNYQERRELLELLKNHPEWIDKINNTQEYVGLIFSSKDFKTNSNVIRMYDARLESLKSIKDWSAINKDVVEAEIAMLEWCKRELEKNV